jgi:hypothetical protein
MNHRLRNPDLKKHVIMIIPLEMQYRLLILFFLITVRVESLLSRGRILTQSTKAGFKLLRQRRLAAASQQHQDAELQRDNGRGEMHFPPYCKRAM